MSDVSISYKGTEIASLDDSGTKTLLTSGKYCEDDIEVAYTKPSGGSSVPDFTLAGTQTITEPVSQVTFSIPAGTTQLLIVVSSTITASKRSYYYWYFNNDVIFYYNGAATSMSARNAIYGKMVENGGQSYADGVTLAGASVGNLQNVQAIDLSVGGTLKLTGYYADSQLTGGTISVYWR